MPAGLLDHAACAGSHCTPFACMLNASMALHVCQVQLPGNVCVAAPCAMHHVQLYTNCNHKRHASDCIVLLFRLCCFCFHTVVV